METIFCQLCGTPNSSDANFCKGCGKPLAAVSQNPPSPQPVYPVQYQQPVSPQYPQQPVYQQQPNIPLQPVYVTAPPKKKKIKTLILGLVLGIVGICVAIVGYAMIFTQPIQNTANDFLTALQNQDYNTAYNMMAPEVQSQLVSPQGLQEFMESNGLVFNSYKGGGVRRIAGNPPQGVKMADLTLTDGTKYTLEIDLQVGENNVWQIIGFGAPAQ